jgi:hypothetical protein
MKARTGKGANGPSTAAAVDSGALTVGQTASGEYEIALDAGVLRRHPLLVVAVTFRDPLDVPIAYLPKAFADGRDQ